MQGKKEGEMILIKHIRIAAFLMAVILLTMMIGCQKDNNATSSQSGTVSESQTASRGASSSDVYELEDYIPPQDGIDYELEPLPLNQKLGFITRSGDKLMDGSKELRFISANGPTALDSSPFEQEDLVKTVAQMGGKVLRTYTFSVRTKNESQTIEKYILGKGEYNETAFKRLDNLLALCNKYGVRLIIPFIDPYTYNGGIPAFLEMCGVESVNDKNTDLNAFYSSEEVKIEFFRFVTYVLNRTNTITGVKYKNDPAIMAWESGNEMHGSMIKYNAWIQQWCDVVKQSDKKHLLLDGWFGVRTHALSDPRIDIVSHHFYPHIVSKSFVEECKILRESTKGIKAAIIGEFGFATLSDMEAMYTEAIQNGLTGTLFWSLRSHDVKGGFVQHQENEEFSSYHWPGFKQGERYQETEFLRLTYLKAYEIQGKKTRIVPVPDLPEIIEPIRNPQLQIKWKGSTGAYGYDFQRGESPTGPWITIGVNISDDFHYATVMFKDTVVGLQPGKTYYYRMRARSAGGFSEWTKPVETKVPDSK